MTKPKLEKHLSPYKIESEVERFHWWFEARRKLLASILSSIINVPRNNVALEVGCGTGANLRALESTGLYEIGLDQSFYALTLIKKKGNSPLLAGDLNHLPLKAESVGLIIAMDVFEHLEQDEIGIGECFRVLKKGGWLFLTVPAFRFLWGAQDEATGHKRRYSIKEIRNVLRQEGFDILRSSYFNFFLFFPILITRRMMGLLKCRIESENKINHPIINTLFKAIFYLEPYLLKYLSFPFGVSIFCIAKKG